VQIKNGPQTLDVSKIRAKKNKKKGFLGGRTPTTPPPESAPVDSHILMRHIYRIWVQNLKKKSYSVCLILEPHGMVYYYIRPY
jgi:hypothetical protein